MCVCMASKPPICIAIIHHLYALTYIRRSKTGPARPEGKHPDSQIDIQDLTPHAHSFMGEGSISDYMYMYM